MNIIENIRTTIALFIVKYAHRLADFIQPPCKRVKIPKGILAMVTRPLPDLTLEYRKFSPMFNSIEIDRSELTKAIKTAEPIVTDDEYEAACRADILKRFKVE